MARLYGFDYDFLEAMPSLTDEVEQLLKGKEIQVKRGRHWTTDAGYHETWEQVLDYRSKGALCVEMEGVGYLRLLDIGDVLLPQYILLRMLLWKWMTSRMGRQ